MNKCEGHLLQRNVGEVVVCQRSQTDGRGRVVDWLFSHFVGVFARIIPLFFDLFLNHDLDFDRVTIAVDRLHDLANERHNRALLASLDHLVDDVFVRFDDVLDSLVHFEAGDHLHAQFGGNLFGESLIAVNDGLHHNATVRCCQSLIFNHFKQVHQFLIPEALLQHILEIEALFEAVSINVLVDPNERNLGIDLERPDKSGEKFDAPWVFEHHLDIKDVHAELVAESAFDFEGHFFKESVHA